jgi:hypothetical protein
MCLFLGFYAEHRPRKQTVPCGEKPLTTSSSGSFRINASWNMVLVAT